MKRTISLILALLLALGCLSGLAEGTEDSGATAFLRIKENVTAQVYAEPGNGEATDTMQGGQFCGLIDETEEAGATWFHVFYLNSGRKAATGYIDAENAERISQEELAAMMQDPERVNDLLDLVDALNEYLTAQGSGGTEAAEAETAGEGKQASGKSVLGQFYEDAMKALKQVFSTDVAAEIGKITDAGTNAAKDAVEKGKDALQSAVEEAKEKLAEAGKTGKEMLENAAEGAKDLFGKAKEAAGEKLEELKEGVADAVETLQDKDSPLQKGQDELKEKLTNAVDALKEIPVKERLDEVQEKLNDTIDSLQDGSARKQFDDLTKRISDSIGTLKENAGEKFQEIKSAAEEGLGNLDNFLGEKTGDLLNGLNGLITKAREALEDTGISNAQIALSGVAGQFKQEGFKAGVEMVGQLLKSLFSGEE